MRLREVPVQPDSSFSCYEGTLYMLALLEGSRFCPLWNADDVL